MGDRRLTVACGPIRCERTDCQLGRGWSWVGLGLRPRHNLRPGPLAARSVLRPVIRHGPRVIPGCPSHTQAPSTFTPYGSARRAGWAHWRRVHTRRATSRSGPGPARASFLPLARRDRHCERPPRAERPRLLRAPEGPPRQAAAAPRGRDYVVPRGKITALRAVVSRPATVRRGVRLKYSTRANQTEGLVPAVRMGDFVRQMEHQHGPRAPAESEYFRAMERSKIAISLSMTIRASQSHINKPELTVPGFGA